MKRASILGALVGVILTAVINFVAASSHESPRPAIDLADPPQEGCVMGMGPCG